MIVMAEKLYDAYHQEIELTQEQQACLKYTGDRTLMVKGYAGAGKSLVLMAIAQKYVEKYELEAPMYWGMSLQELLALENKTEEQRNFVDAYLRSNPMDMSQSTMNKICLKIETYMNEFKLIISQIEVITIEKY